MAFGVLQIDRERQSERERERVRGREGGERVGIGVMSLRYKL